jgi:hypothetical protein
LEKVTVMTRKYTDQPRRKCSPGNHDYKTVEWQVLPETPPYGGGFVMYKAVCEGCGKTVENRGVGGRRLSYREALAAGLFDDEPS